MISMGWNSSLTNQNMICITKSQGANIHVFHPLHLGTSALGNKLSWDQRQISWGVTEPARFFSYYATCRCSWPGSGGVLNGPAAGKSKLAFWCGFNVSICINIYTIYVCMWFNLFIYILNIYVYIDIHVYIYM